MTKHQAPHAKRKDTVTPLEYLSLVHPPPWRVIRVARGYGQEEVHDADGNLVMSFDGKDDGWLFRGIVEAVNAARGMGGHRWPKK